jgi:hypothetical protein
MFIYRTIGRNSYFDKQMSTKTRCAKSDTETQQALGGGVKGGFGFENSCQKGFLSLLDGCNVFERV